MINNLEIGKKIIKEKIPLISNNPGVYRMLGAKKEILYIGKAKKKRNFKSISIGLNGEREKIYKRINKRVDLMIEKGLLAEAQKLYPNKELNALQTVGYRELFSFFEEKITKDKAIIEIKKNTRRFAKRQLTWFKKDPNTYWFNFETDKIKILKKIEDLI